MQFAMIWSIAVGEFFPTLVGLFIVGIMLYRYIKLKKLCTFLFCSQSKALMLRSPARTIFFSFLLFLENKSLQDCSLIFVSRFGGL